MKTRQYLPSYRLFHVLLLQPCKPWVVFMRGIAATVDSCSVLRRTDSGFKYFSESTGNRRTARTSFWSSGHAVGSRGQRRVDDKAVIRPTMCEGGTKKTPMPP
jgi:hypothetical protein